MAEDEDSGVRPLLSEEAARKAARELEATRERLRQIEERVLKVAREFNISLDDDFDDDAA